MKLTDLTPEAIVALYKKHGLRPRPYDIVPTPEGCCGLGIIAVETDPELPKRIADLDDDGAREESVARVLDLAGIDDQQRYDFESGFDNAFVDHLPCRYAANTAYQLGFETGALARKTYGDQP